MLVKFHNKIKNYKMCGLVGYRSLNKLTNYKKVLKKLLIEVQIIKTL